MQVLHKRKGKVWLLCWFLRLLENRLPFYLAGILFSTAGAALGKIAKAWIVESVMTAAQTGNTENLLIEVIAEFTVFLIAVCTWRLGIIRYNIEGKKGVAKLEKMIFSKAMRLPMVYYEEHHSGEFISKLTFDTERAGDIYASRLRRLMAAILSSLIYLIPMFYYSPELTGCLLGVSVLSFIVNSRFLKPMKEMGGKLAGQNSVMTERLTNMLAGMEVAKMFPMGKYMLIDYKEASRCCDQIQKKTNRLTAALESFNCLFELLGALAFLGIGVWFAARGMVTIGALTAIYTLYGSFRYMFLDIGRYLPQMMNCLANIERLYDFLQAEEEPQYYTVPETNEGEEPLPVADAKSDAVTVENLSFAYHKERNILQDFSMKVEKGKCVALTGESGCGKSTLAKLLLGFYMPQKGKIEIFGKNWENTSLNELRCLISYVPQEPYLYGVSIAENIAYGRSDILPEDIPMEDIVRAAQIANAHEFIMQLPKGYQTIPGERGNLLSGGERQRIAIARAVLRDAPILVLDEATSALDNESGRLVNEALDRICKGKTTIMIAHRKSTIMMADEVIAMG
ncbi:MAG: ABC transporter ATP-binding protein [Suilimivivens sp.]